MPDTPTMSALNYLSDRTDPRVQDGLRRRCRICAAPRGDDCRHIATGQPLSNGQIVHLART